MRNLNVHKLKRHEKMHLRVLRKLADVVVQPYSITFEKLWQSGKDFSDREKRNLMIIFKRVKRRTLGTNNQ